MSIERKRPTVDEWRPFILLRLIYCLLRLMFGIVFHELRKKVL
jgi:hypothetical protein